MKLVSGIITATATYMVVGAGLVLGIKAAQTVYENGLGDKIAEGSKKLFNRK
jgi:hypothetical protein